MTVRVIYRAQFRTAASVAEEELPLSADSSLSSLWTEIVRRHPNLQPILLRDDGSRREAVLVFVNDLPAPDSHPLVTGDVVTLLAPMAGG